jgi:Tfp pilus assembly protein FimT
MITGRISQKKLRAEAEALIESISQARSALEALQARCRHPAATKTADSDTGNYCRSDDSYWFNCVCPDCGLRWTEDQ